MNTMNNKLLYNIEPRHSSMRETMNTGGKHQSGRKVRAGNIALTIVFQFLV